MTDNQKFGALEAILFVAGEAISVQCISEALQMTMIETESLIDAYRQLLASEERGVELIRLGEKVQLRTNVKYAQQIQQAIHPLQEKTLSQSVLETLSIIAYKQPITRTQIEGVKGVSADYSIRALLARNLICPCGRADTIGRPLLYATTDEFLRYFNICTIEELPPLHEETEIPI